VLALAFGELELLPDEFYKMSWKEFYLMVKGYNKRYWLGWEHTRLLSYTMASTVQRKKRLPSMKKWMPLPTDDKVSKSFDESKMDAIFEALKNK